MKKFRDLRRFAMNRFRMGVSLVVAAMVANSVCVSATDSDAASDTAGADNTVTIDIDTASDRKAISPLIYGVNSELMYKLRYFGSIRAGGNRFTAYNWENNASNAGSDWNHSSDDHLQGNVDYTLLGLPGSVALNLDKVCDTAGAYSLMTLQMAGYASADKNGQVSSDEVAPSNRFVQVMASKGSEFSLTPDLNDGFVYMDEFVNYLVETLGDAAHGGINAYSLDNEPALWQHTHPLVHPDKPTCAELIEKTIATATAVKAVDPYAEIFGPALFGYGAFTTFSGAPDWNDIRKSNPNYKWFIDYYLDEMAKAEESCGTRLVDVLDVHFYTEAKGACGTRYCTHFDDPACVYNKLNATRSLWDDSYTEDSWITDTGAEFLPILPALQKSIDTYYPGTKIAITEYDFGGPSDVCGAICQADALGIFAQYGVYCANLFAGSDAKYQVAALSMFTNYDGQGTGFGDTLVSCKYSDVEKSTAYASIYGDDEDVVTVVVTNKSFTDRVTANINLGRDYPYVHVYSIDGSAPIVNNLGTSCDAVSISDGVISYEMEPMTVSLLVLSANDPDAPETQAQTAPETEAPTEAPSSEAAESSESSTGNNITAFIICAVAILAVVLAAVIIIISRNKRTTP